nr:hypothetical protein [Tanacetum cinerariifolium]
KDHHQQLKQSGETLESSESKRLKRSHSTEQPAELQETTFVSAGATIAAGDTISAVPSVSVAFSIPVETPITAGVSTTAGVSKSAGVASVPIIDLLDSPPKATSLPLEPTTVEQRVAEELERESKASAAQSTQRQAELDRIALNLTNEEWISLVDQVWANPTLSAELLGADVSEDTFSIRMVELMNQWRKAIAEIKAKAKRDKPLTTSQQKEYMRAFVKNQSTAIYTTGWT